MQTPFLLVCLLVAHVAFAVGPQRTVSVVTNTCVSNTASCSLQSRTTNQQQQNGVTNYDDQITMGVAASAGQYDVFFKYQPLKNQAVVANGQLTFISVHDWDDTNGDKVPQDSELTTTVALSAPIAPSFPHWDTVGVAGQLAYLPVAVDLRSPDFNLTCYIVSNFTYLFPDGTYTTGYASTCTVSVSTPIATGHRIALKTSLSTTQDGYGVGSVPAQVQIAPFTGLQGYQVPVGGLLYTWKAKATPEGGSSATGNVYAGPFEAGTGGALNVVFGLDVPNSDSMSWDFSFQPEYVSGASRIVVSTVAMLAMIVALVSTL